MVDACPRKHLSYNVMTENIDIEESSKDNLCYECVQFT